jgi:GT2 family glycosyltransferase
MTVQNHLPTVSVIILYYRSLWSLTACLDSVAGQDYPGLEVLFMDNASRDGAADIVRRRYEHVAVLENSENLFFCRANNIGIHRTGGDYVVLLNADVVLTPGFITEMVKAAESDPSVGMVSGKLLRMGQNLRPPDPPVLDSAGMAFSRQMRHFDRGADEIDRGQFEKREYVFGPSGAAPLYRRDMLADTAVDGQVFDEAFVIYREDADLAWRAQLMGWKGLYTPRAVAYHARGLKPGHRRRDIAPVLNMHSVKNRFLMRLKNQTRRQAVKFAGPAFYRDLLVIGYVLLAEHRSLPALWQVIRLMPATLKKRRVIQAKKRADEKYMIDLFMG